MHGADASRRRRHGNHAAYARGRDRAARLAALALGLGAALWFGGTATTPPMAAAPALDPAAQAATQTATPLIRLTPPTATSAVRTATSPAGTTPATAPATPTGATPPGGGPPTEQGAPDPGTTAPPGSAPPGSAPTGATGSGAAPTGAPGTLPPPGDPSLPAPIAPPVHSGGSDAAPPETTAIPVVRRVGPFGVPQVVDDPAAASLWRGANRPPDDLEADAGPVFEPTSAPAPARPPGGPVLLGLLAAAFAALTAYAARGLWRSAG